LAASVKKRNVLGNPVMGVSTTGTNPFRLGEIRDKTPAISKLIGRAPGGSNPRDLTHDQPQAARLPIPPQALKGLRPGWIDGADATRVASLGSIPTEFGLGPRR
jgi:hypothetical protein